MPESTRLRWVVLLLTCMGLFGQYFAFDIPAALNAQLEAHLGKEVPAAEYQYEFNLLYSVYSVPNVVLPFLFGFFIDRLGVRMMLACLSFCLLVGQGLLCVGVMSKNISLMLAGRFIFGIGGESMNVAQAAVLADWFRGKEIAFALGLNLSVARAGSVLNDILSPAVEVRHGIVEAFLVGFGAVVLSCFATLTLILMSRETARTHNDESLTDEVRHLKRNFWLVALICVIIYAVILPFNNIAAGFLSETWYSHLEPAVAHQIVGNVMSILFAVSALLSPVVGLAIDRYGQRLYWLLGACLTVTLAHMALPHLPPPFTMTLLGLAYTVFASAVWPLVSLTVEPNQTGIAYGSTTALQNVGLTVVPLCVAWLRASTGSYALVEVFFSALGFLGVCLAVLLLWLSPYLNEKDVPPVQPKREWSPEERKPLVASEPTSAECEAPWAQ